MCYFFKNMNRHEGMKCFSFIFLKPLPCHAAFPASIDLAKTKNNKKTAKKLFIYIICLFFEKYTTV